MKKRYLIIFIIVSLFSVLMLTGCNDDGPLIYGTYVNENNPEEKIVLTEDYIEFVNIDWSKIESDYKALLDIDVSLDEILSGHQDYRYRVTERGPALSVYVSHDIGLSLQYSKQNKSINLTFVGEGDYYFLEK